MARPVLCAAPRPEYELLCAGGSISLGRRTLIMGVLNITPDSFSDGGRFLNPRAAIRHALAMANDGADWIDVGGESTRPGAEPVSIEEESRRVLPVIRGIRERLPELPISVDTTKSEVAELAIRAGASIVNDISGLRFDSKIADVARRYHAGLILMHMRGRPATMQKKPFATSIFRSLSTGLERSIESALDRGLSRSQLIIDPGLGFGKTRRQNFEILARLAELRRFKLPILIGASRKSFMQAIVTGEGLTARRMGENAAKRGQVSREDRLAGFPALDFGDAAAAAAAALAGAHVIRAHNVAAVAPALHVADAILAAGR